MEFQRKHYIGRTTIVTVAGPVQHERVAEVLTPILRRLPTGRTPRFSRVGLQAEGPARVSLVTQDTEQTHLAMGFHAFGRKDERRFALKLLSVILGENMSSRLFQKLRERHGYCYSVQTSMVTLQDTGAFSVYAGLDPEKPATRPATDPAGTRARSATKSPARKSCARRRITPSGRR